jgi:hypothetical protein
MRHFCAKVESNKINEEVGIDPLRTDKVAIVLASLQTLSIQCY